MELKNFKVKINEKEYDTIVPYSLYSILIGSKELPHPYYNNNEKYARDLSNQSMHSECEFSVDESYIAAKSIKLIFYGLDTIASINLNEEFLGDVENMHRKYEFEVKNLIKLDKNKLVIEFHSPIKYIEGKQKEYELRGFNAWAQGFAHIRKSNCSFGWDWGPQLPDMGVFRPIELKKIESGRIESVYIRQNHSLDKVKLNVTAELSSITGDYALEIMLLSPSGKVVFKKEIINNNLLEFDVCSPKLWWPNNLGAQNLYSLSVKLFSIVGEEKKHILIEENNQKIGLRDFKVVSKNDEYGKSFTFCVNGVEFFAMGGDYIPEDAILPYRSNLRTRTLLEEMKETNINCVRVWGGGFYPDDYFYEECDRLGIIVWQDFMFACSTVYFGDNVKENLTEEFKYNIKRLRNHPSLGLFCGNNEIEMLFTDWKHIEKTERDRKMYLELFENFLPELCKKYAEDVYYLSSSPTSGGNFDNPNDILRGDSHFWTVWHGLKPFEEYAKHTFRFCSEFGFESFPDIKTIKTFAKGKQLNIFSETMENHQKCADGNARIIYHMSKNYPYPNTTEKFVYISQLVQADAIACGVEHMRRERGKCMGAIYWQINDCWPVSSWSSIDYFGRKKALAYRSTKFFAPVAISCKQEDNGNIGIYCVNDSREDFSGICSSGLFYANNLMIAKNELTISVKALSVIKIGEEKIGELLKNNCDLNRIYFCVSLYDELRNSIMDNKYLFVKPKHFKFEKPNISLNIIEIGKGNYRVSVKSDVYVMGVELYLDRVDCKFSDNFFDLTGLKREKEVVIEKCSLSKDELIKNLKVRSVADI